MMERPLLRRAHSGEEGAGNRSCWWEENRPRARREGGQQLPEPISAPLAPAVRGEGRKELGMG